MRALIYVSLAGLLAPAAVFLDLTYQGGIPEVSFTEILQALTLLWVLAWDARGAVASTITARSYLFVLFLIMFIRGLDWYFDFVFQGFWFYVALGALAALALARKQFGNLPLLGKLVTLRQGAISPVTLVGLSLVLVFSRIIGHPNMWIGSGFEVDQVHLVKTMIQEGLELYGYLLCLIGLTSRKTEP